VVGYTAGPIAGGSCVSFPWPRNRVSLRLALSAILGLLSLQASALAANEFKYDPLSCKADAHGSLYIALDQYIFAVPWGGDVMIDRVPAKDRRLVPVPGEPEGCPGNPAQMRNYSFLYALQAAHEAQQGVAPAVRPSTDLLQLIVNSDSTMDRFELDFAEQTCRHATVREELPNGLTACRVKPVHDAPIEDWGASYIARSEIYKTPQGGRFAVDCDPGMHTDQIGYCGVAYMVLPGLFLTYRFQPFLGPRAIPIADIIEFDRGLRTQVNSMLIKDFIWPTIDGTGN